jgi:hypothetical protein
MMIQSTSCAHAKPWNQLKNASQYWYRYQPLLAKDIPVVPLASECDDSCEADIEDGSVRIIAGNYAYKGTQGAALTFSPVTLYGIYYSERHKAVPPGSSGRAQRDVNPPASSVPRSLVKNMMIRRVPRIDLRMPTT